MSGIQLKRLGMLMESEPGNPQEAEGICLLAPFVGQMDNHCLLHGSWRSSHTQSQIMRTMRQVTVLIADRQLVSQD